MRRKPPVWAPVGHPQLAGRYLPSKRLISVSTSSAHMEAETSLLGARALEEGFPLWAGRRGWPRAALTLRPALGSEAPALASGCAVYKLLTRRR